jgi:hypothetical protein
MYDPYWLMINIGIKYIYDINHISHRHIYFIIPTTKHLSYGLVKLF